MELSLIDMPLTLFSIDTIAFFTQYKKLSRLLFRDRDYDNKYIHYLNTTYCQFIMN